MRRQGFKGFKGFTLIELLIVVSIILIIAAIAVPNLLRGRIAANESSAVGAIRTVETAEIAYTSAYNGFSTNIGQLGPGGAGSSCPATGPVSTNACLIDSVLANATTTATPKSGYYYGLVGTQFAFGVGASPASFNQSGVRNFCASEDGVIHTNAGAAGSTPVTGGSTACTGAQYPPLN